MKKHLFVFFAALLPLLAFPQDCKYMVNEIDEFTGDAKKITEFVNINKKFTSRYYLSHSFSNINGEYVLNMQLTGGGQSLFISKGRKLYLKLTDGQIITLQTIKNYETEFRTVYGGGQVSSIVPNYPVTKEQLLLIEEIGIAKIRQETDDSNYETDVTEKDNAKIKQAIDCVL